MGKIDQPFVCFSSAFCYFVFVDVLRNFCGYFVSVHLLLYSVHTAKKMILQHTQNYVGVVNLAACLVECRKAYNTVARLYLFKTFHVHVQCA